MIVAMVAVGVMKMAVDQIIDVIAVRDRLVAAAGAVHVIGRMRAAVVRRRAGAGIGRRHVEHMLLDGRAGRVMQMPVVQVIDVVAVLHRGMPATLAVRVIVLMVMAHFLGSFAVRPRGGRGPFPGSSAWAKAF